jgi:hypothetical protein
MARALKEKGHKHSLLQYDIAGINATIKQEKNTGQGKTPSSVAYLT